MQICARSVLVLALFACSAPLTGALDAPNLTVPLPPGETLLQDLGTYRIGWQSYGAEPVWMPVSWSGHFDDQTGISYEPWGKVLGRERAPDALTVARATGKNLGGLRDCPAERHADRTVLRHRDGHRRGSTGQE